MCVWWVDRWTYPGTMTPFGMFKLSLFTILMALFAWNCVVLPFPGIAWWDLALRCLGLWALYRMLWSILFLKYVHIHQDYAYFTGNAECCGTAVLAASLAELWACTVKCVDAYKWTPGDGDGHQDKSNQGQPNPGQRNPNFAPDFRREVVLARRVRILEGFWSDPSLPSDDTQTQLVNEWLRSRSHLSVVVVRQDVPLVVALYREGLMLPALLSLPAWLWNCGWPRHDRPYPPLNDLVQSHAAASRALRKNWALMGRDPRIQLLHFQWPEHCVVYTY